MEADVQLKIPMIGGLKLMTDPGGWYTDDQNQLIKKIEDRLGEVIKKKKSFKEFFNFLFPVNIDKILQSKSWASSLFTYPLLLNHNHTEDSPVEGINYQAAWANLMYDLGEFRIAGLTNSKLIQSVMPHIYKKGDDWHSWWANFQNASDILRAIWKRLAMLDVQVVFIDDDPEFRSQFLGGDENPDSVEYKCNNCDLPSNAKPLIFMNTGPSYEEKKVKDIIGEIIKKNDENDSKLLVFVVDLIYKTSLSREGSANGKRSHIINFLKGDSLIEYIRSIKKDSLIIGFTGGTSPFIINSAEKAGADIVTFKKRGSEQVDTSGHTAGGNSVGIFDLLWAISWNVSVWRLLKASQKKHMEGKDGNFKNLVRKFFPDLENISPFWKACIEEWKMQINNEKIRNLFK